MRFMLFFIALLMASLIMAPLSLAQSEPDSIELTGKVLPQHQLPDAFGNVYQLPYPGLRHVLFSADMEANDLMEQSFGQLEKGDFTAAGLAYVADISGMPGLVARFFAIPSLRDYPFRVLLARKAEQVSQLPHEEGAVTVLSLSPEGNIEQLSFVKSESALKALLTR